ncbi:MAG: site-2 protease family protein, partial [Lentisphaeria bacterium]|nr:site-2 protease family protein [Lentisphaeria bacterium]
MMYDILLKIGSVAFMVIFFGLCIFIHELGHFLAAKWRGLYIGAFSIGFRKIWWKKIGGVEYRIGCIPVGGYVELPQVDASGDAKDADGNILPKAKPLDRLIVAFAGPLFNMIFGLLLGVVIWIHGIPQDSPVLQEFKVTELVQESPEYKAGLRNGDVIVKLNGESFSSTWNGFVRKILFTIGDITLTVKRQDKVLDITYKPAVNKNINPDDEIAYPFFYPEIPVYLYPRSGSAAEKAGIRAGDRLLSINGKVLSKSKDLEDLLLFESQGKVDLVILRKGRKMEFRGITPELEKRAGEEGIYLLGFSGNPVVKVLKDLPMEKAGLRKGDKILSVNGKKVSDVAEIREVVKTLGGKATEVVIFRSGKEMTLKVAPRYLRYNTLGLDYAGISHPTPFRQLAKVM